MQRHFFASLQGSNYLLFKRNYPYQCAFTFYSFFLFNKLGQLIEQRRLGIPAMRSEWDVSGLIDGLYMIEIQTEDEAPKVLRFVKD